MPAALRSLVVLALLAMAFWVATHLRISTDITNFMPHGSESSLAALSAQLADSELTRTMAISLEAPRPEDARAAARELAQALTAHPEVAWVRTGVDGERLGELFELVFPRRHGFLSREPEREIPELTSETALRARARAALRRLAQPSSTFLEDLIARDPLGAFERVVERLRGSQAGVRLVGGQLVSPDGRHALLLLGTRSSAFDSAAQAELLAFVDARFAELAARRPGLRMEQSGANRFAVHAEQAIRGDVHRMVSVSALGILLLFVLLVGSLRSFVLISLPAAAGIVTASFLGLLVFGRLDGLTMAFGATLMGVAIDYPIHLSIHRAMEGSRRSARALARLLRPTLVLGAVTTMASFAGLGVTAFPAFREMAFFAITGVAASLATTLWVLPGLLERLPPAPPRAGALAEALSRRLGALERRRRALWAVPLLAAALAPVALPRLVWVDDLTQLSRFDPALRAEDQRVRERVAQFETGRIVVGLADDRRAALALDETVQRRLARSIEAGHLAGTRSVSDVVWSEPLQRANQRALRAEPDLAGRVARAYAAEGFAPDAFDAFAAELAGPAPAPLTLDEVEQSPLRDLVDTLLIPLGDRVGAVTYLRGVRDAGAVAATLADLPDVHLFDQRTFLDEIYAEFRETTLRQMLVGSGLVVLALALRYRRLRPALAAFLPSAIVALLVLEGFVALGIETNLFHVMSLVMVMGMGVDYGVFLVDSAHRPEELGATLLSLLVASLTTVFVFGTLALSDQPALRAIGVTTGIGITLSLLAAPLSLAAALPAERRR